MVSPSLPDSTPVVWTNVLPPIVIDPNACPYVLGLSSHSKSSEITAVPVPVTTRSPLLLNVAAKFEASTTCCRRDVALKVTG